MSPPSFYHNDHNPDAYGQPSVPWMTSLSLFQTLIQITIRLPLPLKLEVYLFHTDPGQDTCEPNILQLNDRCSVLGHCEIKYDQIKFPF